MAAQALNRLSALTGEDRYARAAERTLELFYPAMRERPAGFGQLALALEECLAPPRVLVLRGERAALGRWQAELAAEYLPDTLVLAVENGMSGLPPALDKPARAEPVNGWLCRGVTCLAPISALEELRAACKAGELR